MHPSKLEEGIEAIQQKSQKLTPNYYGFIEMINGSEKSTRTIRYRGEFLGVPSYMGSSGNEQRHKYFN